MSDTNENSAFVHAFLSGFGKVVYYMNEVFVTFLRWIAYDVMNAEFHMKYALCYWLRYKILSGSIIHVGLQIETFEKVCNWKLHKGGSGRYSVQGTHWKQFCIRDELKLKCSRGTDLMTTPKLEMQCITYHAV